MDPILFLAFFQEGGGNFLFQMFPIIVFFILLYFVLLRPQIKQQREHRSMIDNLKKGDKVITNGGIWGEIDTIEPKTARIRVSDKTKITVTRSAISGLQPQAGDKDAS